MPDARRADGAPHQGSASFRYRRYARILRDGGIIAYPTEAVFGLGCDPLNPEALHRLLELKGRRAHKGLILIAADRGQLAPFLAQVPQHIEERLAATWPGPVTWVLPAADGVPDLLTGGGDTLAVRVTDHPVAAALCRAFGGPIVSTSANRSNRQPARTALRVRILFGDALDAVVPGEVGGLARPTRIIDGRTGTTLRE